MPDCYRADVWLLSDDNQDDLIDCFNGIWIESFLIQAWLLVAAVLLLNMLIAMLARTFDAVNIEQAKRMSERENQLTG